MRLASQTWGFTSLLICLCASMSLCSSPGAAQTDSKIDDEYSITTFEGPKEGSFGLGDGKMWFLQKNALISLKSNGNRATSVPMDEIETRSWMFGGGSVWILGKSKNLWGIHRIDPHTGKVVDTIVLDHDRDQGFLYGEGSIWVWTVFVLAKEKPLLRIDPETKHVSEIDLGKGFKGQLVISDGKVWLFGVEDGTVKCLDPKSNKVIDEFSIGREHHNGILKGPFKAGSYSYGIGNGLLWVLDTRGTNGEKRVLSSYDLQTHEPVSRVESDDALFGPVIWNGYVWLSVRGDVRSGHYIVRIDPAMKRPPGRIFIPTSPGGREANFAPPLLEADGDSLWALSHNWFNKNGAIVVRRIQSKEIVVSDDRK